MPRPASRCTGQPTTRTAAITTIAFAAGILAADSYASDEATVMSVVKCARLPNGDVAGGAGDLGQVAQALSWLEGGCEGDPPEIAESIILFTKNGEPHMASTKWPALRVKGNAAIGSGAQGALVAMNRYGATAEEAVRAVSGIDPCSGGEVDVLPVEVKRGKASQSKRR